MSKKNLVKFVPLGTYGPFELSYNPRKDVLTAKADDITMSCVANDAIHHRETYPALALAFSRLIALETHMMTCDGHHDDKGEETTVGEGVKEALQRTFDQLDDDARESFTEGLPEMPQALKDVLKGMARGLVKEVAVPKGTPEEDMPGRPVSEAPADMLPLLEAMAKDLGVPMENMRFIGGTDKSGDDE